MSQEMEQRASPALDPQSGVGGYRYWRYMGIMEKKMETTIMGYIATPKRNPEFSIKPQGVFAQEVLPASGRFYWQLVHRAAQQE